MAKAILVRRDIEPLKNTPEVKMEGLPYRAEKKGHAGDPGEVHVSMSMDEAFVLLIVLGNATCTLGNTSETGSSVWAALSAALHNPRNPFKWNPPGVDNLRTRPGYLTDLRLL